MAEREYTFGMNKIVFNRERGAWQVKGDPTAQKLYTVFVSGPEGDREEIDVLCSSRLGAINIADVVVKHEYAAGVHTTGVWEVIGPRHGLFM